jgi:hypothetical protein
MAIWGAWNTVTFPSAIGAAGRCSVSPSECLIGCDGTATILRSTDGKAWTSITLPSSQTWVVPLWTGTAWLLAAYNSTICLRSTDGGVNWLSKTLPAVKNWQTMVKSGSRITLFANAQSATAYSLDDGVTWTTGPVGNADGVYASAVNAVPVGVAVDSASATNGIRSTDGFVTLTAKAQTYASYDLCYDDTHSRFISTGSASGTTQYMLDSGTVWAAGGALPVATPTARSLHHFDGITYCAAYGDATNGAVHKSSNGGVNWTADTAFGASTNGRWSMNVFGTGATAIQFAAESGTLGKWRAVIPPILALNATLDSVGLAASIMQASTLALNATLDSVGLAARVNLLYPPTLTLNATLDSVGLTASIKQATTLSLNATLDSVGLTAQLKVLSIYEKISWAAGASDASPMPVPTYQVMRLIDNYLLDHADKLFKVSGWTTVSKSMPRVLASPIPVFQDNLDTSLFSGDYLFIPYSPGTTSKPSSYQATYSNGVRLTGGLTFSDIAQLNTVIGYVQNLQPSVNLIPTTPAPTAAQITTAVWANPDAVKMRKIATNKKITDPVTGIMTVYEDGSAAVAFTAQLWEDAAGTIKYRGQGFERIEVLA